MHTIFLALGSNVGDKRGNLMRAINLLREQVNDINYSTFYETVPMYFISQDSFLNGVLTGTTNLQPSELLEFAKELEIMIGRQKRFPNGPREIDIDLLYFDNLIFSNSKLTIPHPRIPERDFVLRPLMEIAPDFIHPGLKLSTAQMLAALEDKTVKNPSKTHADK